MYMFIIYIKEMFQVVKLLSDRIVIFCGQ